jgi:urea transport system ATP-binding protein
VSAPGIDIDTEALVAEPGALVGDVHHPVLEIRGLVVSFGGFKAIDGVDFTVNKGEVRFIIGPNGAGKTTLIDVITGLTKASEGTVEFFGDDITGMKEHKVVHKGIGRSFQTPTVFEHLTVVENLDLAASFRMSMIRLMRRRRGVSDIVASTLRRIGMPDKGESLAGTLSHGQKQWLEIGMLLVQEPKLLLLDEPVAGMSNTERTQTGELLLDLAGDHTVVVVEHDMAFLRKFASVVTVMHEGKILSEGSVHEVQSDERVREVYLGRSRDERSGAVVTDDAAAFTPAAPLPAPLPARAAPVEPAETSEPTTGETAP